MISTDYDSDMEKTSPANLFSARRVNSLARRACNIGKPDADFLVRLAAETMAERLAVTQRQFDICADLYSPFGLGSSVLGECENTGKFHAMCLSPASSSPGSRASVAGDLETLPFGPGSLSLVTSLFMLHRSNDLPGMFAQIRKALRPDGLFMACLPGDRTLNELRHSLIVAESEVSEAAALRVDPFGQVRQYGDLLQRAGFALPVVDSETLTVRYSDMIALIHDLRAMGATAAFSAHAPFAGRTVFDRASQIYQETFADEDGRIRATFEIVYLSGWAPDPTQQKPLRPGSASNHLKDFL